MRFDIITLFPELFTSFLQTGVTRRAFVAQSGHAALVQVHCHNPRDFAEGNYRRVDDRPFGGGPGMVMQAEPLARCIAHIQAQRASENQMPAPVILFSPQGKHLKHAVVADWAAGSGAILLCGRYEGIDQRLIDALVNVQISLGDFVLSGGEVPAMALLDAVARLQPGVLGDADSHAQDSFNPAIDGLLDCPHYTRPEVWQSPNGEAIGVPEVLLGGNHAEIERWRKQARQRATQARQA
jgi:tRNA (guanine37-N1)-methyltransferase